MLGEAATVELWRVSLHPPVEHLALVVVKLLE
jgi:hypothetical protein